MSNEAVKIALCICMWIILDHKLLGAQKTIHAMLMVKAPQECWT